MAESSEPSGRVDPKQFRRAGIVAFLYAIVDFLIILGGSFFVPLRLIGVAVAIFVIKDMLVLHEAGLEWGWTRYLVLIVVAVGGFLGFFFYAWRRRQHLEDHSWPDPAADQAEDGDDIADGAAQAVAEQEPTEDHWSATEDKDPLDGDTVEAGSIDAERETETTKAKSGTDGPSDDGDETG